MPSGPKASREPKCRRAVVGRLRAEDHLHLLEAASHRRESTPRATLVPLPPSRGSAVAPEDRAVGREGRAQRDVEQAALPARVDRRHAGDRRPDLAARGDDAQAPGLLGDEQVAVGQRLDRPRILEPAGEHDDVEGDVRARRRRRGSGPANAGRWSDAFGLRSSRVLQASAAAACGSATPEARTKMARATERGSMRDVRGATFRGRRS